MNLSDDIKARCALTGQDYEKFPTTDGWDPDETFEEGQIWLEQYSPYAAIYCNETQKYMIVEIDPREDGVRQFQMQAIPEPTEEEKAAQELVKLKSERADAVSKIVVEVDGMNFDGDEISQGRMARTVSIAVAEGYDLDTTKRTWVLADNTIAEVTVRQLAKACELAGNKQTELWTVPYEG